MAAVAPFVVARSPTGAFRPPRDHARAFDNAHVHEPRRWSGPARQPGSPPLIRVTGFNKFATTAIRAATHNGCEFLEVPWRTTDSVISIMKRLEAKICIPIMYWRLATGGTVLEPGAITQNHPLFANEAKLDLVLVPLTALDEYEASSQRTGPGSTDHTSPREQAMAKYNLLNPSQSEAWPLYIQQRSHAEKILQKKRNEATDEFSDPLLAQISEGVAAALRLTSLNESAQRTIAAGVVPLFTLVEEEDDTTTLSGEANVWTRIYSATAPAAVDVQLKYYRFLGGPYHCTVLYRIHASLAQAAVERYDMHPKAGRKGWRLLFSLGLKDRRVGRRNEWDTACDNDWGASRDNIQWLREVLFGAGEGSGEEDTRAGTASGVATVCFLLAAVGMPFLVAVSDSDDGQDGQDESIGLAVERVRWEISDPRWLGAQIRKAGQVVLKRDMQPIYKEPEYAYTGDKKS